jgi:Subtilase family
MPAADGRLQVQIEHLLSAFDGKAAPSPPNWLEVGEVDYLYREFSVLVRDRDVERVLPELLRILEPDEGVTPEQARAGISVLHPIDGVTRLDYSAAAAPRPVPDVLGELDVALGVGVARPDHVLYGCGHCCPAHEPEEVPNPTVDPFPALDTDLCCGRQGHCFPRRDCDGENVFVSIVDTGWLEGADAAHAWLAGVDGDEENPLDAAGTFIRKYAGHGTFVAGCLRVMAPRASVYVHGALPTADADFETNLVPKLEQALDKSPDIVVFTFASQTRLRLSLPTFDALYENRIRPLKGLAFLAPAGNDGERRVMWPAAYPWVVSVGALAAGWRTRAQFSNFGGWVDVYAPGEDLVNAFATGRYLCDEPPFAGKERQFHGMAKWSGTSFSTPLVAGLIAARMSATGENGQQAAEALLRFARSQSLPGVGAVLYPGQACTDLP